MKNKAYEISSYRFNAQESLLFDANVWLDIYGPQGNPSAHRTQVYSKALENALKAGSSLYMDVLILSEFVNRFARLEHGILQSRGTVPRDFKAFRNTTDFVPVAENIANNLHRILRYCKRIESGFSSVNVQNMLAEYKQGGHDINDQILIALCKAQGLIFVTHDADFKDRGLTILSANKRLLN